MLVCASRMGLSLGELYQLDMATFQLMCAAWAGEDADDGAPHVRRATQEDIDRLMTSG